MKHLIVLAATLVLAGAAPFASAAIPDPSTSECPACITIKPDGSLDYVVTVRDANSIPVSNSLVEILFSVEADNLIAWCQGQAHPSVTATTIGSGEATFQIAGGGCVRNEDVPDFVARVYADGILLCEVQVNSPDRVNAFGDLPIEAGDDHCTLEGGTTSVGLSDGVAHTDPIAQGLVDKCSKFVAPFDAPVGLQDAVFVTACIISGIGCTCP